MQILKNLKDTIQARSDLDFGGKFPIVQFYTIEYNSKSNRGLSWKLTRRFRRYWSMLGSNFRSIKVWEGIIILVNIGCMNFIIYFLLTCGLSILLWFFSYKDVVACFGNLLALLGSSMGYNIVFKCGKDS